MATQYTILLHWQKFDTSGGGSGLCNAGTKIITFTKGELTQTEIETEQATIKTADSGGPNDNYVIDNIKVLQSKLV